MFFCHFFRFSHGVFRKSDFFLQFFSPIFWLIFCSLCEVFGQFFFHIFFWIFWTFLPIFRPFFRPELAGFGHLHIPRLKRKVLREVMRLMTTIFTICSSSHHRCTRLCPRRTAAHPVPTGRLRGPRPRPVCGFETSSWACSPRRRSRWGPARGKTAALCPVAAAQARALLEA